MAAPPPGRRQKAAVCPVALQLEQKSAGPFPFPLLLPLLRARAPPPAPKRGGGEGERPKKNLIRRTSASVAVPPFSRSMSGCSKGCEGRAASWAESDGAERAVTVRHVASAGAIPGSAAKKAEQPERLPWCASNRRRAAAAAAASMSRAAARCRRARRWRAGERSVVAQLGPAQGGRAAGAGEQWRCRTARAEPCRCIRICICICVCIWICMCMHVHAQ